MRGRETNGEAWAEVCVIVVICACVLVVAMAALAQLLVVATVAH